ncbi:MAG: HEPN domain-containing protein [Elusimicrobia bacterium]|nr:HEPN domain-containing protein [Elusimicrobiota bacterium]
MNEEFRAGINKKRILTFSKGKLLVQKELCSAQDDLNEAKDRMNNKKYKYVTITAYYSMFHSALALLYSKGYREKSHYYLLVALNALFVNAGLLEEKTIKDFRDAMVLREEADYHGEFSQEGALSCLESADKFLFYAKKILNDSKKT